MGQNSLSSDKASKLTFSRRERKKRLDNLLCECFDQQEPDSSKYLFGSFLYYPKDVSFLNKDLEEELIVVARRHFFTNAGWIAMTLLLIALPALLVYLPFFDQIPMRLQIVFLLVWYMITMAYALEKFLSWFFQVNIITDERVIDIDFMNIIYREITDANIDKIEDVTTKVGGAVRTYMNYGDVVIQTSAELPQITFDAVARPDVIARILRDMRIEEEQEKIEGRVR